MIRRSDKMNKIIVLLCLFVGGSIGYNSGPTLLSFINWVPIGPEWVGMLVGSIIGYFSGLLVTNPIHRALDKATYFFGQLHLSYLLFGSVGLVIGLIISRLIGFSLQLFGIPLVSNYLPFVLAIVLGYLGFYVGSSRHRELSNMFGSKLPDQKIIEQSATDGFCKYKILDTSTIIDGRILDVIRTGFLEGTFVVSKHVLKELQYIADASDNVKRARGRRGLDILNALQKEPSIQIEMNEDTLSETDEVDLKLVHLAKKLKGVVITNDFNLNKVAEFQHVKVLNVNELASVIKPVVIPGEQMTVYIVKKGTERHQGVAYLDDGTMIVVKEGQNHIGEEVRVIVTSSLQTNAGKMIFAKMVCKQKEMPAPDYNE